jgi:Zn-dependent protease
MPRPLLVFEDIETSPRRRLFRFQGVEVMSTPYAWYSVPFFCILGIMVSFGQHPESATASTLKIGLEYGVLLYLSNALHSLGHILAAKIVGAPMEILLLTGTRDVTLYRKRETEPSKWMFIGRSLGGPLTNMIVGFIAFGLSHQLLAEWLLSFSVFNLAIAVWTLFPIPSMDGWVIWGELLGFRKHA